jgi:hypothetical protein
MKKSSLLAGIFGLSIVSSCSFGVGSVSYELNSNILGTGNPDVALVPHVSDSYLGKFSPDPVFLTGNRQQLYLDKNPGSHEAKPEELVPEFSVYVDHVFLRNVSVSSKDYTRDEIQYPMYPKQVTYTYKFSLSDNELKNALATPPGVAIVPSSITTTSFSVKWLTLVTNGMSATGIRYRPVLTRNGLIPSYPDSLNSGDTDVTSATFDNLSPDTKYLVSVVFGDLDGHLGRLPQIMVQTDKLSDPTLTSTADLAIVRQNLIGTWKGTMNCPWWPTTLVTVEFLSDGTYRCSSQTANQTAMYYGSDTDTPEKKYTILSTQAQFASMDFELVFGPGDDVIEHVDDLTVDSSSLHFSFLHFDKYGPIVYDLQRQ